MAQKQLKYIIDICPQTIECGKHIVKPLCMKKKMMTLSNDITQNFIKYGKAWKQWCYALDEQSRINCIAAHLGYYYDEYIALDYYKETEDDSFKSMKKIAKEIEKQLDAINWGSYHDNLDR